MNYALRFKRLCWQTWYLLVVSIALWPVGAWAQGLKLLLPVGHTNLLTKAIFYPDGKRVVTASFDNTAKVWDVMTGALLLDLKGHTGAVEGVVLSPDGKKILTFSQDNTAKVWDAENGTLLLDLKGHTDVVVSAVFNPMGTRIVTIARDSTFRVWNVQDGSAILKVKSLNWITAVAFSPDGTRIVTGASANGALATAKVWDVASGIPLMTLTGHTETIYSVAFSPNGQKIITAGGDVNANVWDANSGTLLLTLQGNTTNFHPAFFYSEPCTRNLWTAEFSADGKHILTSFYNKTAKVWDAVSGHLLADLRGHTENVTSASFSPDGIRVVTASEDSTAKVWDSATGSLLQTLKGHQGWLASVAFSSDSHKIITASGDKTARIWNIDVSKMLVELSGHCYNVTDTEFSQDGNLVSVISDDDYTRVWDIKKGRIISSFKLAGSSSRLFKPNGKTFSPDGKRVVTVTAKKAVVWEVATGNTLLEFQAGNRHFSNAAFSTDGKQILTAGTDARIWNAETGGLLQILGMRGFTSFSPDGRQLVTCSFKNKDSPKVWNVSSGNLLFVLKGHKDYIHSFAFSSDGRKIVTGSQDKTAKVWNAHTGELMLTLSGHTKYVQSVAFSPDGKLIATASFDNTVRVWDATTGISVMTLPGKTGFMQAAVFSPNGQQLLTAHDGITELRSTSTGKVLYSFLAVDTTDYLVVDPHYRYDGSEAARKLLYFTCGGEIINLDQLKDQLWVPGLAQRIARGETINAPTIEELDLCGLTPEVEPLNKPDTNDQPQRKPDYRYRIHPRRGGLGTVALAVNGIEVRHYEPKQLRQQGHDYELRVPAAELAHYFVAGQANPVTVTAYTAENAIASRGAVQVEQPNDQPAPPPNLYAVVVGVSDYKGEALDLKYAAKDAHDLAGALATSARRLLNRADGQEHVFVHELTTGPGREALPEKQAIKATLADIGKRAVAGDIVLLFFAGHGVTAGADKRFYFLTADASPASAVDATSSVGISTQELGEWLRPDRLKAQKRVLIFDACQSGQAINDFVKLGDGAQPYLAARSDDAGQRIKAVEKLNNQSGLFVLAAASSTQSAYEMSRYSQGLLTYALLRAIKEQPDILDEGHYLSVARWFGAADKGVQELAQASGQRQQPQVVSTTNFNIGEVDEAVRRSIALPQALPVFATSNFQNADPNVIDDDLGLSRLLDRQLQQLGARGSEAPLVYAGSADMAEAYVVLGRYTVQAGTVRVQIRIRQNGKVVGQFEVSGVVGEVEKLAADIARLASERVGK